MHPPPTDTSTLSLHDALPILARHSAGARAGPCVTAMPSASTTSELASRSNASSARGLPRLPLAPANHMKAVRSEEHTSELQSLRHLVCRLLLEKKKTHTNTKT